jgi:hypothetical protein
MKFTYASGQKPLEGYTIKRGIGRGGFGEVYFGVSDRGKEVAMKLIQANHDVELRGIQQCLNLKHPNLVHLYDLRTDAQGDHWLIMEHVAGEPLSAILGRHPGGVAPELAAQWFQGLAAAVHHLHDHGIVHRDLKPGNIFLENGFIKVGDYGLCKSMGGSQQQRQTQSVGTVHYMAPEIATGNYKHQVDIYAAGVILYEMLTGQVPFDGESAVEILFKHQTERPDLSKVPAAFVPILDRALSKNPALRFQSLGEMSKQVAAMVAGRAQPTEPLRAPPVLEPALRKQYEAPTQLLARPYQRLAEVGGTLLVATLLAAVSAFALAVLGESDWRVFARVFFLTTLGCAAVLILAPLWTGPADESWTRRLTFMGLGLLIGVAAVWLDGFQLPLPWSGWANADSLHPFAVGEAPPRHRFFGLLYRDNSSLPVLAGYLSYFGLMFLALRWWKIGEQTRRRRFNMQAVLAVGFWAYILLFLLPAAPQRQEAFWAFVLTAAIVQLVSPWTPRTPERSKKVRLRCA